MQSKTVVDILYGECFKKQFIHGLYYGHLYIWKMLLSKTFLVYMFNVFSLSVEPMTAVLQHSNTKEHFEEC